MALHSNLYENRGFVEQRFWGGNGGEDLLSEEREEKVSSVPRRFGPPASPPCH